MVVHRTYSDQGQQSPAATATATRKKLSLSEGTPPSQEMEQASLKEDNLASQQQPPRPFSPPAPPAIAAPEIATDQWCERNSATLLEACCNHDLAKATKILEQSSAEQVGPARMKQLVDSSDDFRDSALHLASGHGEARIVRLLLARGADVEAENNLGSTPLNRAAVAGKTEIVEILIDAGANLEHQDDISGTALHAAARRNHSTCCRLLLNRGAKVDTSDGIGNRPLHLATAEGAISVLKVLVKHNADPQLRNMRGQTPLDVARASWIGSHCKEKIARILAGGKA